MRGFLPGRQGLRWSARVPLPDHQRRGARTAALAGILFVLGARLLLHLARPMLARLDPQSRLLVNLAFSWGVTALLLLHVFFWERKGWESIGFRRLTWRDAGWAVAVFIVGGIVISATMPLLSLLGLQTTERGVRRLAGFSAELRAAMVLTAGITEEIRYRGYLIERLHQLTGRLGQSAAISWLAFVLVHIPAWTAGGAIQIGLSSILLYLLYVKRRSLPACMLAHLLNNTVAFFVVPALLPRASP